MKLALFFVMVILIFMILCKSTLIILAGLETGSASTVATAPAPDTSVVLNTRIAYLNGTFYVFYVNSDGKLVYKYSSDGENWSSEVEVDDVDLPSSFYYNRIGVVTIGDHLYVIYPYDTSINEGGLKIVKYEKQPSGLLSEVANTTLGELSVSTDPAIFRFTASDSRIWLFTYDNTTRYTGYHVDAELSGYTRINKWTSDDSNVSSLSIAHLEEDTVISFAGTGGVIDIANFTPGLVEARLLSTLELNYALREGCRGPDGRAYSSAMGGDGIHVLAYNPGDESSEDWLVSEQGWSPVLVATASGLYLLKVDGSDVYYVRYDPEVSVWGSEHRIYDGTGEIVGLNAIGFEHNKIAVSFFDGDTIKFIVLEEEEGEEETPTATPTPSETIIWTAPASEELNYPGMGYEELIKWISLIGLTAGAMALLGFEGIAIVVPSMMLWARGGLIPVYIPLLITISLFLLAYFLKGRGG